MTMYAENCTIGTGLLLQNFEIFKGMTSAECADVSKLTRLRTYKPDSYIISETQNHNNVFFIVSGKVRSCALSQQGKQVCYEDLHPGMMFGEFAAIDNSGRSADCLAIVETVLVTVSGQTFLDIMDNHPSVKDAVLRRLVKIARNQMQRVTEFSFFSVNQRVRLELIRMGNELDSAADSIEFPSVPTHAEIALRIGTHREAVTRELRSLHVKGLITWDRGKHIIHDVNALVQYAES